MTDTDILTRRKRPHHTLTMALALYLSLFQRNHIKVPLSDKAVELPLLRTVRETANVKSANSHWTFEGDHSLSESERAYGSYTRGPDDHDSVVAR